LLPPVNATLLKVIDPPFCIVKNVEPAFELKVASPVPNVVVPAVFVNVFAKVTAPAPNVFVPLLL